MLNHSRIVIGATCLEGDLCTVESARGLVVFAHGSGSSRNSPRNLLVARTLQQRGLGTLLFDLLTPDEADDRANVFDIQLLAQRMLEALDSLPGPPRNQPIGLFGASTGAAAALVAAAIRPDSVQAVVSRGGRPDLAYDHLALVRAATLLIVGGADTDVLELNRAAYAHLRCEKRIDIVPRATRLFEEAGALEIVGDLRRDTMPRRDTSLDKLSRLPPVFDRTSGQGTLTAGNSSLLTDGAASLWVASAAGLAKLPGGTPRAPLVDWEIAAVDFRTEGLLMAPAFAIPRLLVRNGLAYSDIHLWEIHEAFSAQVLFHLKALESIEFLRSKAGVDASLGMFPRERMNPHGGSVALGHPFGATGARILSQAVKELAGHAPGERAIVSICTDGGQGTVALLEAG